MDLQQLQRQLAAQGLGQQPAPVHTWNPEFCGNIDICIKRDGSWHHDGTPIGRLPLIKLFASVLRKDGDSYYLVTPTEKVGIAVEDSPFVITSWQQRDNYLIFTSNLDDTIVVGEEHPVVLQRPPPSAAASANSSNAIPVPYVLVRHRLRARLHQNVFYQLVEQGTVTPDATGGTQLLVHSGNYSFSLGQL